MRLQTALIVCIVLASGGIACGDGGKRSAGVATNAATAPVSAGATVPGTAVSVTAGAGPDEQAAGSIRVAAASDLRRAMTTMQSEMERTCNTRVTYVFGSSGQLKEQVLAGAGYHLFLSADTAFVEELDRAGKLVPNGRANYAVGRIVFAWRAGLPPLASVADLTRSDIKRIAIANPAHAPYGRAAQQAMSAAGVWDTVQGRLVLGENIRQATDYVEGGNADAGILALALVIDTDTPYKLVEATSHRPIIQAGGVVKGSRGELSARCVLQFILDPAGQQVLKKFGFEPVPAP